MTGFHWGMAVVNALVFCSGILAVSYFLKRSREYKDRVRLWKEESLMDEADQDRFRRAFNRFKNELTDEQRLKASKIYEKSSLLAEPYTQGKRMEDAVNTVLGFGHAMAGAEEYEDIIAAQELINENEEAAGLERRH